ncbi:hypothetical protein KAZ57_02545, partial [Patescibacteria group bacterium]|nr:hypothetical protein [Patescibacteria group bacterium]
MKTKTLSILIFFTCLVFFVPKYAQAQEATVRCMQYDDAQLAEPDTNVISTSLGTALAQLDVSSFFLAGDDTCDLATQSFECIEAGDISGCVLGPVASSRSNLLGMTGTARALATGDVIPVNFAYYFRDQVKNVPIVGAKVYAQDSYADIYGASLALAVWKAFRNMALGLMSIFLIVIGIMIIMRKKVDPRTVLTLQTALPKVIISMVLIVFSFAIGALFIRFVPAARSMANTIFTSVTDDLIAETVSRPEVTITVSSFGLLGLIGAFAVAATPGIAIGALTALIGPLTAIVWIVLLIMVY